MVGLNSDTPLGYVVSVRAEKDQKRIKEMTNKEKEIRKKWVEFKSKNHRQEKKFVSIEDINKVFSQIFN